MLKTIFIHLLNDFSGSPKVLSQVLKRFEKSNDIELYTSKDEGFLSNLTANHKHFFYKRFNNKFLTLFSYVLSQLDLFFKILKYKKEDTIYINTLLPFGAAIAGKLKACEVIYHIHETSIKPNILKKFLRYVVSKTASKIIFVSNDLASKEAFENKNTYIVHNALENNFLEIASKYEYKFLYDEKFIVTMICSLKEYKGVLEFITIASNLVSQNHISFKLILNAEQTEINNYFENKNIPSNIEIFSKQKDLEPFYSKSSLVLNLSRVDICIETFGLTIIEAMAYGIPVIVPPVGGPIEIVEEGLEGFLISSYEIDKVAKKIAELSNNEITCINLSKNAKEKALIFSEDLFLGKIQKVVDG